jgi:hypothetical protein
MVRWFEKLEISFWLFEISNGNWKIVIEKSQNGYMVK